MDTLSTFNLKDLNLLISKATAEGSFDHSILTDDQGLPIASSFSDLDQSENEAAAISLVQRMTEKISDQFQFTQTSEFVLHNADGKSLVIKPFRAGESNLILSVLIPDRHTPYRRITGRIIRQIKSIWAI